MTQSLKDRDAVSEASGDQPRRRRPGWLREVGLAAVGSAVLAVVMTWPTAQHLATRYPSTLYDMRHELHDPMLVTWMLAWVGHALLHQPLDAWQANAFYPEPDTFAFSDSLFGYAPLGMVGSGPVAAIIRYNLVTLLVAAMAFFGMYVLARQLGSRWPGAVIAAAAFAYAPWRIAQIGHLHILSTGGIALALAALARGHGFSLRHGYRPEAVRPGWAIAGWAIACWQLTIGFGIGVPFAYALGVIGLGAVVGWLLTGRPRIPGRLLAANIGGGIAFAGVAGGMALPYLRVVERFPEARRSVEHLELYSPPLRGLATAPEESWLWGDAHAGMRAAMIPTPEVALLPGFLVIALAVVGIALGAWPLRYRLLLGVVTVTSAMFAMGTALAGGKYTYLLLFDHMPGWDAIRTPGRLILWTTFALCLLAAGLVTAIAERWRRLAPLLLVPAVLVLVEGVSQTPHVATPPQPAALRDLTGPALILPMGRETDKTVMYWTTDAFPRIVNGESGFRPPSSDETRSRTKTFPDAASVEYLRDLGVRKVVVLRELAAGTPYNRSLTAPVTGLPVKRSETEDAVIFTIG